MKDVAIIGTGPAGVSAALNAKIRKLDYVWFGSRHLSEKAARAEKILNYPGLPELTGEELREAFERQVTEMQLEITEKKVQTIYAAGDSFMISAENDIYEAKTVILTIGATGSRMLPGEEELLGRGVSYCATCDGGLYRGKKVAVFAAGKEFVSDIAYLQDLVEGLYLIPGYGSDSFGEWKPNVQVLKKSHLLAIQGGKRVEGVEVRTAEGTQQLPVDGVFLLREAVSPAVLLPGLETEQGHIVVDRRQQTNFPGCFAAGDCTGRPYQYAKAVGEGNVALHSAIEYLQAQK